MTTYRFSIGQSNKDGGLGMSFDVDAETESDAVTIANRAVGDIIAFGLDAGKCDELSDVRIYIAHDIPAITASDIEEENDSEAEDMPEGYPDGGKTF